MPSSPIGPTGVVALDVSGAVVDRALPGWARHITIDGGRRSVWVGARSTSEHVAVVDFAACGTPRC